MKVKELIAELLKQDPTGEAEVAIDNKTVYGTTGVEPGYYDGTFFKVHFSEEAKEFETNFWGVSAVEMGSGYKKINLRYMDMEEAFLENPEAKWIANRYNDERDAHFREEVEKFRVAGRALQVELAEIRNGKRTF